MPEGPEILYSSIAIERILKNLYLDKFESFTNKPIIIPEEYKEFIENKNAKVSSVECKGKLLWIKLEGYKNKKTKKKEYVYIHIHYGITGWLYNKKPQSYIKYEMHFSNNKNEKEVFYMMDKRRFSKIKLISDKEHENEIKKLGIDIFTEQFTLENFSKIIKAKNTILANYMMEQKLISGIGNYIKNDSLYLTKLEVNVKTKKLSDKQIKELHKYILLIAYSILSEHLLTSQIPENLIPPNKIKNIPAHLEIPYKFKVYGQEKAPDGKKIYKVKVGGRDSYSTKEYIPDNLIEALENKKSKKSSKNAPKKINKKDKK